MDTYVPNPDFIGMVFPLDRDPETGEASVTMPDGVVVPLHYSGTTEIPTHVEVRRVSPETSSYLFVTAMEPKT